MLATPAFIPIVTFDIYETASLDQTSSVEESMLMFLDLSLEENILAQARN